MLNRSCERCRTKKLRCPGGKECENCLSINAKCIYLPRKLVPKKRNTLFTSPSNHLTDQLKQLIHRKSYEDQDSNGKVVESSTSQTLVNFPSFHSNSNILQLSNLDDQEKIDQDDDDDLSNLLLEARSILGYSLEACELLLNTTFRWRVLPTIHAIVHIETLIKFVRVLYAKTEGYHGLMIEEKLTIDQLSLLLLCLSASILFSSSDGTHLDSLKTATEVSLNMKDHDSIKSQKQLYSFASRLIEKRVKEHTPSLEGIQSMIVFIFHHSGVQEKTEQIGDRALRFALKLGLHRVTELTLVDETKVRVWWFLVTRNWLASPSSGVYTIFPNQFSTRLPLNVEYRDLEWNLEKRALQSIQREWTPATYSLSLIMLATAVRGLVDERNTLHFSNNTSNQSQFQSKIVHVFDSLTNSFVWFYKIENQFTISNAIQNHPLTYSQAVRIEMERWMLHPQLFHCFLEVYQIDCFIEQTIPKTCLTLARHILRLVESCSQHCALLSSSGLPKKSLLTAASVVAVDVLKNTVDGNTLEKQENEFIEVVRATRKVERMKGQINLQSITKLESLVTFWSNSAPEQLVNKVEEAVQKWELEHDSMSSEISPIPITIEEERKDRTQDTFLHSIPQLSSLLPAYQADRIASDWEEVWTQLLANEGFPFQ